LVSDAQSEVDPLRRTAIAGYTADASIDDVSSHRVGYDFRVHDPWT